MNICEHLTATAKLLPDKVAIVFEGDRFTFARLDSLSRQAGSLLVDAGIRPGDRVAMMLPNVPAFAVWYYAALRVGAIAVSISTRLTNQEVAFVVGDCGAKVFVSDQPKISDSAEYLSDGVTNSFEVAETGEPCNGLFVGRDTEAAENCYEASPQDPAVILYTSGTTGFAKGRYAFAPERLLQRQRVQSSLWNAARRSRAAVGAIVSLLRSERLAEFRAQRGWDDCSTEAIRPARSQAADRARAGDAVVRRTDDVSVIPR